MLLWLLAEVAMVATDLAESIGSARLYVDDQVVAQGPMKTQPGKFTLSGDGLCVGFDSGA